MKRQAVIVAAAFSAGWWTRRWLRRRAAGRVWEAWLVQPGAGGRP